VQLTRVSSLLRFLLQVEGVLDVGAVEGDIVGAGGTEDGRRLGRGHGGGGRSHWQRSGGRGDHTTGHHRLLHAPAAGGHGGPGSLLLLLALRKSVADGPGDEGPQLSKDPGNQIVAATAVAAGRGGGDYTFHSWTNTGGHGADNGRVVDDGGAASGENDGGSGSHRGHGDGGRP